MRIYQLSLSLACAVCLAACSAGKAPNTAVPNLPLGAQTTHHVGSDAAPSSGADTGNFAHPSTETEFADALIAPLSDLNLVRTAIPPVLLAAARQPYAPPKSLACHDLATAIAELDHVLGADLDTQESQHNPSLIQRGSGLASEAVVDAVRDTTSGIIPFRGWIRRLTGAAKHAKEVTAAISAGAVRRAYLKGLGQAQHCPAPPAPAQEAALAPASAASAAAGSITPSPSPKP